MSQDEKPVEVEVGPESSDEETPPASCKGMLYASYGNFLFIYAIAVPGGGGIEAMVPPL